MIKVRFAPSPTGFLHVGNVRTALVNWLFAKKNGGHFLLRIDDTDTERSKAEYEEAIKEDLGWLGISWDSLVKQSDRFDRYTIATETLKKSGRLYACFETAEELDVQRKMLASRGLPPIYKRASEEQKQKYEAEGRKAHWRFLLNDEEIVWDDLIRGHAHFKATHMSDPVLVREDGVPLYTLASVVDDGELGATHVIRGEDHVSNTAVQIQIYKALGYAVPTFAHMALLKTKDGELSKRLGGNDIRSMREMGILPMAINSLLAKMGTSDAVEIFTDMKQLVDSFDFKKFGRAPANYDAVELEKLNEKLLNQLPFSAVAQLLPPDADEESWNSIRMNVKSISDAIRWFNILRHDFIVNKLVGVNIYDEDKEFLLNAASLLPPEPWDESTYDAWLAAVKPTTPRKGKELFMPIRRALTGMIHGPELKKLLPLIGAEKTKQRLTSTLSQ